eukprot:9351755-Alexandrium_andersonii.AAC.1
MAGGRVGSRARLLGSLWDTFGRREVGQAFRREVARAGGRTGGCANAWVGGCVGGIPCGSLHLPDGVLVQ